MPFNTKSIRPISGSRPSCCVAGEELASSAGSSEWVKSDKKNRPGFGGLADATESGESSGAVLPERAMLRTQRGKRRTNLAQLWLQFGTISISIHEDAFADRYLSANPNSAQATARRCMARRSPCFAKKPAARNLVSLGFSQSFSFDSLLNLLLYFSVALLIDCVPDFD
ncbi:MAG TPA: hypothetical protein VF182_13335 [Candidatus Binatia bacterium]